MGPVSIDSDSSGESKKRKEKLFWKKFTGLDLWCIKGRQEKSILAVGPNKMMSNILDHFEVLNCRYGENKRVRLRNGSEINWIAVLLMTLSNWELAPYRWTKEVVLQARVCPWRRCHEYYWALSLRSLCCRHSVVDYGLTTTRSFCLHLTNCESV